MSGVGTQNHRWSKIITRVVVWGIVILGAVGVFYPLLFHGTPVTTEEGRREHGNGAIHAPFCCVYVGLEESEQSLFKSRFQEFAKQQKIRLAKRYTAYSGPPRAQFVNERLAVYVRSIGTSFVVQRHGSCNSFFRDHYDVGQAMWNDCYWPTNASKIPRNGQETLAPITGSVGIASYITNYPAEDFKQLADLLKTHIKKSFPDRRVEMFVFVGPATNSN